MSILQRKGKVKNMVITEPKDYDFGATTNDLKACGLEHVQEEFVDRNKTVFTNLKIDAKLENPVAIVASKMEKCMSKRELAYLLAKSTLIAMMQDAEKKSENN